MSKESSVPHTLGAEGAAHPIEIAPRLWWVGHYLEGDPFQCHAYLLEQGDQSVLFDPGSRLTVTQTLEKIEQLIPLASIKYFVCHHQDPDITAAMPLLDTLIQRPDALLVTHWRARVLLRHLGLENFTFWNVEEHDWQLELEDRTLRFVFTPYAHFPGAFCTFDEASGTLLSSDLFGGFTEGFQLFAEDESYFEALRPFHEHYIPTREIMGHALDQIQKHAVTQIAPQHGSILRGNLVPYTIARLRELECGLYLLAGDNTDVLRLSRLNVLLRDVTSSLLKHRDFRAMAGELVDITGRLFPVDELEFFITLGEGGSLHLAPEQRFRAVLQQLPAQVATVLATAEHGVRLEVVDFGPHSGKPALLLPLWVGEGNTPTALAVFRINEAPDTALDEIREALDRISSVLAVAVEREAIYRSIDMERERMYQASVHDPLTKLYTRRYVAEVFPRWADSHDRHDARAVSLLMLDIDHFKRVNDTYGHLAGDRVLADVASAITRGIRGHDVAVRFGGEEMAVFLLHESMGSALLVAERLRKAVAALRFTGELEPLRVTVSLGVAMRRRGEPLDGLVARADRALYAAKEGGRDQVLPSE